MDKPQVSDLIDDGRVPASVHVVNTEDLAWVPLSESKAFRPLRFRDGNRGFVELLRFEPGANMPLHRHSGETHVFGLQGALLMDTGRSVESGGYIFEPAGNVDAWQAGGNEPLVILADVSGSVEYLNSDGEVEKRVTAGHLRDIYRTHCEENGIAIRDLGGDGNTALS